MEWIGPSAIRAVRLLTEREKEMDADTVLFFDKAPSALPIYEAFETKVHALFPAAHKSVRKTQITFSNRHVFACVSFARVKRKAALPDPYIVVTLGLPYQALWDI